MIEDRIYIELKSSSQILIYKYTFVMTRHTQMSSEHIQYKIITWHAVQINANKLEMPLKNHHTIIPIDKNKLLIDGMTDDDILAIPNALNPKIVNTKTKVCATLSYSFADWLRSKHGICAIQSFDEKGNSVQSRLIISPGRGDDVLYAWNMMEEHFKTEIC